MTLQERLQERLLDLLLKPAQVPHCRGSGSHTIEFHQCNRLRLPTHTHPVHSKQSRLHYELGKAHLLGLATKPGKPQEQLREKLRAQAQVPHCRG